MSAISHRRKEAAKPRLLVRQDVASRPSHLRPIDAWRILTVSSIQRLCFEPEAVSELINFPYCGQAPLPSEWLGQWNIDAFLIASMVALFAFHIVVLIGTAEWHAKSRWLAAAWLMLAVLFVSPLCALSSALFSVRVVHHVALIALVAPAIVWSLPDRWRTLPFRGGAGVVFILNIVIIWLWHAPAPYAAAMSSDLLFWVMQLSLLMSAIALWLIILSPGRPLGSALTLLFGMVVQMGLLGALITFARVPLYTPHFGTPEPFGLSTLADQQVAGLIMWIPATLPYLAIALLLIGRELAGRATPRQIS